MDLFGSGGLTKYMQQGGVQPTQQYTDLQNQVAGLQSQLQQQQSIQQWLNQSHNYQPQTYVQPSNTGWLYGFHAPQAQQQQQIQNGLKVSGQNYGSGLLGMMGGNQEAK